MCLLVSADRAKLARILGMMGSDHVGERAAAALKASDLLRQRGLTWLDVLSGGEPPRPQASPYPPPRGFAADAQACLRQPDLFTAWEREFLSSVSGRRRLSTKQLTILAQLTERVRAHHSGAFR